MESRSGHCAKVHRERMCHNVKPNLSTVQGCEGTLAISYKYHFPENSPETIRSVRCGVVVLRPGRLR